MTLSLVHTTERTASEIDQQVPGAIRLRSKSRALLQLLHSHLDEAVTKEEIHNQVWKDVIVTQGTIVQSIREIRALLDESLTYAIRTIPKRGYLLYRRDGREEVNASRVKVPRIVVSPFVGSSQKNRATEAREISDTVVSILSGKHDFAVVDLSACEELGTSPNVSFRNESGHATYILHGRLQELAGQVRLDVRLLNAESMACIWSERYWEPSDNHSYTWRTISVQIANAIGGHSGIVAGNERIRALRTDEAQRSAYDSYILGIGFSSESYHPTVRPISAVKNLEACLVVDPEFARAWSSLALKLLIKLAAVPVDEQAEIQAKMVEAALKGIRLDRTDTYCAVMASVAYYQIGQPERGSDFMDHAINKGWDDSDTLALCSVFGAGRYPNRDLMLECGLRAVALHPMPPHWYITALGFAYFHTQQFEASLKTLSRANDSMFGTHLYKAMSHAELGHTSLADMSRRAVLEIFPEFSAEAFVSVTQTDREAKDAVLSSLVRAGFSK